MFEHDRRWYRNSDFIASSLLVVLGVLFFADVLFTSKNFYFRDILNFHYPLRRVLIDSYARGEWPLWNPYVYLGQPMLANPNYMAFYPSNLFHLFLPFNYAFKLHFVIHPILASLGIYFLQRRLSLPPIACFGGAVVYAFSGIVLSFLNLYNFVPSVALLPWIGWALLNALQKRSSGPVLLFGVLLALQILSFDLFIALCDLLLLVALALIHVLPSADRARDSHPDSPCRIPRRLVCRRPCRNPDSANAGTGPALSPRHRTQLGHRDPMVPASDGPAQRDSAESVRVSLFDVQAPLLG